MTADPSNGLTEPAQRLLENVLAGEITATHADVIAMMRRDPAFARTLERLLEVHHELVHLDQERPDTVVAAPAPELELAAAAAMRRQIVATPAALSSRPTARRGRLAIAACAALALSGLGYWLLRTDPSPSPRQTLDGPIAVTELADGKGLHFAYRLPETGYFEVQVLAGDRALTPVMRVKSLDWRPAEDLAAAWPEHVTVRVEAVDGDSATASTTYAWDRRR